MDELGNEQGQCSHGCDCEHHETATIFSIQIECSCCETCMICNKNVRKAVLVEHFDECHGIKNVA